MSYTPEPKQNEAAQAPTPDDTIDEALEAMPLTEKDTLADLGCGDARVLIRAVKRFGCYGVGIEIDPIKANRAKALIRKAGLDKRIRINPDNVSDALKFEPAAYGVTAVYTYLYPSLLQKLSPKLKRVRTVVSPFHEIPGLSMTQRGDVWIYQSTYSPPERTATAIPASYFARPIVVVPVQSFVTPQTFTSSVNYFRPSCKNCSGGRCR